jgi:hypothetical protein
MLDTDVSTEAASASTSAAAETVENTNTSTETTAPETKVETSDPFDRADPWGNLGKEATDEKPAAETVTEKVKAERDPADTTETTDTGKKSESADDKKADEEKADEKPLEDQVLDEVFETGTAADKKAEGKDEDLDAQDREKMLAGQRNPTARAWAERQEKMAEPVKLLRYPDKKTGEYTPIADVASKLEEFNPERYAELSQHTAHKLVDTNPDGAFQRAYAIKLLAANPSLDLSTVKIPTLDEVISGATAPTDTASTTAAAALPNLTELTAELDKEINWDWRDESLDKNFVDGRELAFAKTLRGMEAKLKTDTAEAATLRQERDDLKAQVEASGKPVAEPEEVVAVRTKLHETIGDFRKGVKEKLLPYIAKNTGLEVSKDDTPEIAAFKQNRMEFYTGTEYEQAHGIDSKFEAFAYNESSVKTELETLTKRVVDLQLKESQAAVAKKTDEADKYHRLAEDERVPLFTLLAQANKEFKARYIAPDLDLIGKLSSKLADPIKEASERVEVVSNGGTAPTSPVPKPQAATADGVWDGMVTQAAKDEALRANA